MKHTLLLLNASNMPSYPIYPYAFIQVSAIARRHGLRVVSHDFLGIPENNWARTVRGLIQQHAPEMVLITLRNTDSLVSDDYQRECAEAAPGEAYFPIEQTRSLIATIHSVSDLKTVVGGFGFSVMPEKLMSYLRPDFGVFGGPDGFFANLDAVLAGNYGAVPNLLYFQGDHLLSNSRVDYPPCEHTEYTPDVIKAMMQFYERFPKPGFLGAPVEIMRGCSHTCVFCSEPHVLGRRVKYRDLSVVMGDIEMLVRHNITEIYLISSELNPEGNTFVLELAERIRAFNEQQSQDRKIVWFGANYLLKFSLEEFYALHRSGFTGGWFDVTALDDENARAMRTPYRNARLLPDLKIYAQAETRHIQQQAENEAQTESQDDVGIGRREVKRPRWTMFLGNPATTLETIRRTLRVANTENLPQRFEECHVNSNIRVFDYENLDGPSLAVTFSVTPTLDRTAYQEIFPSFAYPPTLLAHFGSSQMVTQMLEHIAETYLSTKYQETRNWLSFLRENATADSLETWIDELSDLQKVGASENFELAVDERTLKVLRKLFIEDDTQEKEKLEMLEDQARRITESLLSMCLTIFLDELKAAGFPCTMQEMVYMTPYKLAISLFERYRSEDELAEDINQKVCDSLHPNLQEPLQFGVHVILYRFGVVLHPKYRALFVPL